MSEPLVRAFALCVLAGAGALGASPAHGQAQADLALSVRAGPEGSLRCFEVEVLRQRIAHYSANRLAGAGALRLELEVGTIDSAELQVYRGSELVARRRFEHLPAACADRRDAVALSIAMALDGVIRELAPAAAPDTSPGAPAAAGASDRADASPVAGTAAALAESPTEARRASETRESAGRSTDTGRSSPRELTAEGAHRGEQARRTTQNESTQTQRARAAKPAPQNERANEPSPQHDSGQAAAPARRGPAPVVQLHAGGRLLAEALPSPVWTGALGAELSLYRGLAIDAAAFTSTTADNALAGARAQTSLTGGELLGCSSRNFGSFAAEGCLGAIAAACAAGGQNYPVPFPAKTVVWAASTARLALRWPDRRRVSVRMVVQGHVNMVRPELRVDGSTERLAPAWLGGSAGLDMLVSLE